MKIEIEKFLDEKLKDFFHEKENGKAVVFLSQKC